MLEVIIKDQNQAISQYNVNYEEIKNALAIELKKYENLVVSEEYIQMAKKSRAQLNAMKKSIKDRLSEVRSRQLAPYEELKSKYTNNLEEMIDEYLIKIDGAIKEIEKKRTEEKAEEIKEYFDEANQKAKLEIPLTQVFNPKWNNQGYSINKIKADIDIFFNQITENLSIIEMFDDEFVIPLRKLYLSCFDMAVVMKNKLEFDNEKRKRLEAEAEAEKLRKELEEAKKQETDIPEVEENIPDASEDEIRVVEYEAQQNIPEQIETHQETHENNPKINEQELEYIPFWVKVTPEQKKLMRNLVLDNHIKCGKLNIKSTQKITEIIMKYLSNVYCDTCGTDKEYCENCHRKSMLWSISDIEAKNIAEEILK